MSETKSGGHQPLPRKPKPWLFGIAVALAIIVGVVGAHLYMRQRNSTDHGSDKPLETNTTTQTQAGSARIEAAADEDEQNTLRQSGFDILIPQAWRGKADVKLVQDSTNVTYQDGTSEWTLLIAYKETAMSSIFDNHGTFEALGNGNQFCVFPWEDTGVIACVQSPEGRRVGLLTFTFSEECESIRAGMSGGQPGNWRTPLALQAAVAGMSTSEDPTKIAEGCLRAIAETVTFREDDFE